MAKPRIRRTAVPAPRTPRADVYDVAVLGAGASGLICAREAGLRGRRVALIDRAAEPGAKLLVTGGGKCNFTNRLVEPDAYVSSTPRFCISALSRYSPDDFLILVEAHEIPYREGRHGRLFCDRSARDILDMLLAECREAGVTFLFGRDVTGVRRTARRFTIDTNAGPVEAKKVVVATGGLAAPATGATGVGYEIARNFGIAVMATAPALVGLRWGGEDAKRWGELAGVSLPGAAAACGGASFREAVLFTHTGLSGPSVLSVSLYWRPGAGIVVDPLPEVDLEARFRKLRSTAGRATLAAALGEVLPERFARRFSDLTLPPGPLARLSDAQLVDAARAVHAWTVLPAGVEGFDRAEVTRGGVDARALSSTTMEAREVPGLHFTGEVVDVTGRLGGYNLHWAWASGAAAGRAV